MILPSGRRGRPRATKARQPPEVGRAGRLRRPSMPDLRAAVATARVFQSAVADSQGRSSGKNNDSIGSPNTSAILKARGRLGS